MQKHNGGLGFKDIQCFNLALLAKIGWRITHRLDFLLATVLRDKYFPGKTFREACDGRGTSGAHGKKRSGEEMAWSDELNLKPQSGLEQNMEFGGP